MGTTTVPNARIARNASRAFHEKYLSGLHGFSDFACEKAALLRLFVVP